MPDPELVDYIKRQLANGHDAPTIREHLVNHGHKPKTTDAALKVAGAPSSKFKKFTPFSPKVIAYIFLAMVAFGMLGLGGHKMFFAQDNLAGAATDPIAQAEEVEVVQQDVVEVVEEIGEPIMDATVSDDTEEPLLLDQTTDMEEGAQDEESELLEGEDVEGLDDEDAMLLEDTQGVEEEPIVETVNGCSSSIECIAGQTCYDGTCQNDADKDGLPDNTEMILGTEVYKQDSDGDGISDYDEYADGTDALDILQPGYYECVNDMDCIEGETCAASGVCIVCDDSDGDNYKKRGLTKGVYYTSRAFLVAQDGCTSDGSSVLEYHCRPDSYLFYEEVNCEMEFGSGSMCSAGICS
jgi:hypothetical protein